MLNYAHKYPDHLTHLILTNLGFGDPSDYSEMKIGELAADERYLEAVMSLGDVGSLTNDKEFTDWFKVVGIVYCWNVAACTELFDTAGPEDLDLETFFAISMTVNQFYGVFDELASIDIPTLVVAGEHDVFNSIQTAQNMVDGLPNAELMVLANSNHLPTIDNPEDLFAMMIEFLQR